MIDNIGIILIGGTGYGAKEFLRLSLNHAKLEIVQICSSSEQGNKVQDTHKELINLLDREYSAELDLNSLSGFKNKFLVLALPHGQSQNFIGKNYSECKKRNIHILDLSGDFRIKDKTTRGIWYPSVIDLEEEIFNSFSYGMCEINRKEIKNSQNIANPGCFSTGAILSIYPLVKSMKNKILNIAIDGKSGSSGGGKSPKNAFHHPELNASAFSYSALKHRHESEMEECLGLENLNKLAFVPHVIPLSRGMLVSSFIFTSCEHSQEEIDEIYKTTYKNEPFVRLLDTPPEIRLVAGSNFIDINVVVRKNVISVTACLDNLVKGMAGQAIQNINIISGEDETMGLNLAPLGLL